MVAAGLLDRLREALGDLPVAVFDATPSNPTEAAVMAAVNAYRAHEADGLIALGGGSAIDLAKGVAIMATHPGALADYATILGGSPKITPSVAPLIAIPTTAGTGSEVARGAIIVLDDGRKLGFHSWHLVPKTAICDPELTYGLPARLTAATGMDAIAHCIETFLSKAVNPPADAIAFDGLARGLKHIEKATQEPRDPAARWNMMSASMQGAMAFQKGLGRGAFAVACARWPQAGCGEDRPASRNAQRRAAARGDQVQREVGSRARAVDRQRVWRYRRRRAGGGDPLAESAAGAALGLGEMGITAELYDDVASNALKDHCHATNPRVATHADYVAMLAASA